MKRFWEIIYDANTRSMEVIGPSIDDTLLTHNISEMQRAEMGVRCNVVDINESKETITLHGYTYEENLYDRLLKEYEKLTKNQLKRW